MTSTLLTEDEFKLFRQAWYGENGEVLRDIYKNEKLSEIIILYVNALRYDSTLGIKSLKPLDEFKTVPPLPIMLRALSYTFISKLVVYDHLARDVKQSSLHVLSVQDEIKWQLFTEQYQTFKWDVVRLDILKYCLAVYAVTSGDYRGLALGMQVILDLKRHFCSGCGKEHPTPHETMSRCGICHVNGFCSSECQILFWKSATPGSRRQCKVGWNATRLQVDVTDFGNVYRDILPKAPYNLKTMTDTERQCYMELMARLGRQKLFSVVSLFTVVLYS